MQHRQKLILQYIETYHEASVQELSDHLNVSLETIRRDLNKMAKAGLLYRTHGGAVSHKNRDIGRSFDARRRMNSVVKKSIAENALDHFFEGAVIGLDASSSSWNFAQLLPDVPCTVVTSSMHNIRALANKTSIEIIATGGVYSAKYDAFYGSLSGHLLSRLNIDMAIFSCTGIADGVVWESNEMNAIAKRKMLAASKKVFLLADHTKFDRKDLIQLCDLSTIHHLFTDRTPPASIQQICQQHQISITL
ncbi:MULTISPECIES: DeoR/GlpR family DNA-binding transcription regulator [Glaesserella]|uniref:DeoR family transcriptional regulator n=1 Tax=Glaesserella australis TaxID=2094024 RepID=A0A328BW81_9PAST|nr:MULTISPECIES: DeoR/GlpR family DNA-binding transcription regulator [Glaesserella]AUI66722.1 DeoR family transcriptional regulator [Glaesserella sp. 15-184]RAL17885.1 DeoR family transcriptional regulator [Glaesserella australis]